MLPDEFWHCSLRDAMQVIDGFLYREEAASKRGVVTAWLMAALQRRKRLPTLTSMLQRMKRREPVSPEEIERAREDLRGIAGEMAPGIPLASETSE